MYTATHVSRSMFYVLYYAIYYALFIIKYFQLFSGSLLQNYNTYRNNSAHVTLTYSKYMSPFHIRISIH
jgi:hypothetical protein